MQTVFLVFTIVFFAGVAGVCLWLHRRMRDGGIEDPPYWRSVILVFTYGAALYVFSGMLLFFNDTLARNDAIDNTTTVGLVLEILASVLWVYVFLIAPFVVMAVGGVSFFKKGDSVYHRLVYFACAGYAFFLFLLFILMASRCDTPSGGIP